MSEKYLEDEVKALKELEDAELTENQIEAITNFIEFKLRYLSNWIASKDDEVRAELLNVIRAHDHKDKVVVPL